MSMKRHLEYYTHPDKSLKDRSRFWLWNMRGLHGDMDTRYEGDRRLSKDRAVPASSATSPLNFRPVSSETYGYNPRGVNVASRPPPVPEADKPRARDFSIPSKNLDDLMLLREPRRSSSLPRSAAADDDYRPLLPSRLLRHLPIDADLDGLLTTDASEFRVPSFSNVSQAEKALESLRHYVGYVKPYDANAQSALDSLELTLNKTSKFSQHSSRSASSALRMKSSKTTTTTTSY